MLYTQQLGKPGSRCMHVALSCPAVAPALAWMTKVLPAILPRGSRRGSSRVASITPRPVAYSRPKLPCRSSGLPVARHACSQVLPQNQPAVQGDFIIRAGATDKPADAEQNTHLSHRKARSLYTCCTHQTTCRPAIVIPVPVEAIQESAASRQGDLGLRDTALCTAKTAELDCLHMNVSSAREGRKLTTP